MPGSAERGTTHRARSVGAWLTAVIVAISLVAAAATDLLPIGDAHSDESRRLAATLIFVGSYLALAIGRIPPLGIDRAGIALLGAALMVAAGAMPLADAYAAIDLDTRTLYVTDGPPCHAQFQTEELGTSVLANQAT